MIIGLTGYGQSGKDSVARYLVDNHQFIRVAFADKLKQVAYDIDPIIPIPDELRLVLGLSSTYMHLREIIDIIGYEDAKVIPGVREFYQDLGVAIREHVDRDAWVDAAFDGLIADRRYVITDLRFENEWGAVKDAGGVVVRVVRPGVEAVNGHVSETTVDQFLEDYRVDNDDTLDELGNKVETVLLELDIVR